MFPSEPVPPGFIMPGLAPIPSEIPPAGSLNPWNVNPNDWTLQVLPTGLIYRSYLAGEREPRFGIQFFNDGSKGWFADSTLGARVGLLRYGTPDPARAEGWQLDIEGAAFPRLILDGTLDLFASDYRIGVPWTFRRGLFEGKFAFYHLSSHLGDEFLLRNPGYPRSEYARNALVLGLAIRPVDPLRLYAETGWAFSTEGPSQPWEFQFGIEYSPRLPAGLCGAPFFAINTHLREEVHFGGSFTVQTGWQWRGQAGQLFRIGFHYLNGKSDQAQFLQQFEEQIGAGIWYDF